MQKCTASGANNESTFVAELKNVVVSLQHDSSMSLCLVWGLRTALPRLFLRIFLLFILKKSIKPEIASMVIYFLVSLFSYPNKNDSDFFLSHFGVSDAFFTVFSFNRRCPSPFLFTLFRHGEICFSTHTQNNNKMKTFLPVLCWYLVFIGLDYGWRDVGAERGRVGFCFLLQY